jgi:prepilin peptidase CpaA
MEYVNSSDIAATVAIVAYVGLVFAAGVSDILTLTIPNRFSAAIVLLYPSYVLSSGHPIDWQGSLLIAFGAFVFAFVLFAIGFWGGGDAKLFAAAALWAGPEFILDFTLITMAAGGAITIFVLLQHTLPHVYASGFFRFREAIPKLRGEPIPYGAAIAVGALYGAFTLLKVS